MKVYSCLAVSQRAIVGHKVTDRNNSLLILCVHRIVTIHVSFREAKFHTHTTARYTFQQPHILTTVPAGISTKSAFGYFSCEFVLSLVRYTQVLRWSLSYMKKVYLVMQLACNGEHRLATFCTTYVEIKNLSWDHLVGSALTKLFSPPLNDYTIDIRKCLWFLADDSASKSQPQTGLDKYNNCYL